MHRECVKSLVPCSKYDRVKHIVSQHLTLVFYHNSGEPHEEFPSEWYVEAFPKLFKLSNVLRNVDQIDGRLVNIQDDSTITNDRIKHKMHMFKTIARPFLCSPSVQQALMKTVASSATTSSIPHARFSKSNERQPMILNSLTKVCNFLNVSAQQRKLVRFTISPQVTQHNIWTGSLQEILNGLKSEMDSLNSQCPIEAAQMGEQIVSKCLQFLANITISYDPDSTSWMRLNPMKKSDSLASNRWEDLLVMVNDLTKCLESAKGLLYHVPKLEVMKEGLYQIKDVLVERDIRYKEARHQESLVQKKLSKTLGHSSQCLFTLLQYYLCGSVRDSEIEVCGGVCRGGGGSRSCLYIGKILTSDEEKMVRSGVKQLDRALKLFKFVWETAEMKGVLELQGHLWCVGAEDKTLTYRGTVFFLHGIRK